MPIYYQCVACREEVYLPDSKAGMLASCPRCRLKFLAPSPNVHMIPTGQGTAPAAPAAAPLPAPPSAAPTPATASSRPNLGAAANNVTGSGVRRSAPVPAPAPTQPSTTPPAMPPRPVAGGSRPQFGVPAGSRPSPSGMGAVPGMAPRPAPAAGAPARPAGTPAQATNKAPAAGARSVPGGPSPAAPPPAGVAPGPTPRPQGAAPAARTTTPPANAARPGPAVARAAEPARPSAPPSYPRDAAKPPLYPLDDSKAARPEPSKKDAGLFGLKSGELPSLFGSSEESIAMRPNELFAEAIPSTTDAELDDMDVPIDVASTDMPRRSDDESDDDLVPAADEGGGVALPMESSDAVEVPSLEATDVVTATPAAVAPALDVGGADSLISMDDIFSAAAKPAEEAPAFGAGGVLPAPFLKPVEAAPEPEPVVESTPAIELMADETERTRPAPAAAAPARVGSGPVPFALIPVEGISDARFDLPGGDVYLLGRDKDAHVKILSTSVSRRHARIDATGHDHVLIDLGSANGTQVNGQSVARQPLRDGDLIRMGKVILRYQH